MRDERARLTHALTRPSAASSDFDLNPEVALPPNTALKPAAVLVAISHNGGDPHIILTKRASHLQHHPGQIAFPGGKIDAADASATAAALREASEEIGLSPNRAHILGTLAPHETVTGYRITPVFCHVRDHFDLIPAPSEVAEIFTVPLSHLTSLDNYRIQSRMWLGQRRHFYTVPYGPHYIWGATARILRGLAERMQP